MKDFSTVRKLILEQKLMFAILGIILINLLLLDYMVFSIRNSSKSEANIAISDNCGQNCENQINQAVANLKSNTAVVPPVTSAPVYTQTSQTYSNTTSTSQNGPSDYYVPLGTGTSSSTSWALVPGTQAYINSAQYSGASSITFETSVSVPNANEDVYVQLFDVTNSHMVWNSTVLSHSGSTGNLLISNPINLDPGNNLYQVQMQTQLGAPANITQSQVHIHYN